MASWPPGESLRPLLAMASIKASLDEWMKATASQRSPCQLSDLPGLAWPMASRTIHCRPSVPSAQPGPRRSIIVRRGRPSGLKPAEEPAGSNSSGFRAASGVREPSAHRSALRARSGAELPSCSSRPGRRRGPAVSSPPAASAISSIIVPHQQRQTQPQARHPYPARARHPRIPPPRPVPGPLVKANHALNNISPPTHRLIRLRPRPPLLKSPIHKPRPTFRHSVIPPRHSRTPPSSLPIAEKADRPDSPDHILLASLLRIRTVAQKPPRPVVRQRTRMHILRMSHSPPPDLDYLSPPPPLPRPSVPPIQADLRSQMLIPHDILRISTHFNSPNRPQHPHSSPSSGFAAVNLAGAPRKRTPRPWPPLSWARPYAPRVLFDRLRSPRVRNSAGLHRSLGPSAWVPRARASSA